MQYAVLSDIHANFSALKAVVQNVRWLERTRQSIIPFWFLGDLVGYGPASQAIECVRWLQYDSQIYGAALPLRWVAGNHDEAIVGDLSKMRAEARVSLTEQRKVLQKPANRADWDWFEGEVRQAIRLDVLSGRELNSLRTEYFGEAGHGLRLLFTHASAESAIRRSDYLYPWQRGKLEAELRGLPRILSEIGPLDQAETICLLHGHTHFPAFARLEGNKPRLQSIKYNRPLELGVGQIAINPGSVGQPRDGDPRAAFAILDSDQRTIEFRRADYEIGEVINALKMESNGSPDEATYSQLQTRIERADGREELAHYANAYLRPTWDLEAKEPHLPDD